MNHEYQTNGPEGRKVEVSQEAQSFTGEHIKGACRFSEKEKARFWSKVIVAAPDECWLWTRSTITGGYGGIYTKATRLTGAHRFSFELHNGQIPNGMSVCHKCDNPPCCNPAHLWLGTPTDNAFDRDRKGRNINHHGSRHGMAILDESKVLEIRARYCAQHGQQHRLAEEFGVTNHAIWRIVNNKNWKHLLEK